MNANRDGGPAACGVFIKLPTGQETAVSQADLPMLLRHEWRLGANGYVYRRGGRTKGVPCLMHRIITGAAAGQEIHHRNGDKLDNRRGNLELTTAAAHQEHHKSVLIARNLAARIYSAFGVCKHCGRDYEKDPNHRGRQVCCSKACASKLAVSHRLRVK